MVIVPLYRDFLRARISLLQARLLVEIRPEWVREYAALHAVLAEPEMIPVES